MLNKSDIKNYLEDVENIETHDLVEFTSERKKQKINNEFEEGIVPVIIEKNEMNKLEMELEGVNISDI